MVVLKKNFLLKILFILSLFVFLLPFVVWNNSAYPFIFFKAIWLQVFSLLIFFSYLILIIFNWIDFRPRWSWLGFFVFLFYLSILISSFVGEDFMRSWWSRSERLTGIFVLLHFGSLFLVWRSVLSKENWFKLWQYFVGIGFGVLLVALWQIFDSNFLFNLGAERIVSTLGNPIFVAGFCLFSFFSALVFWKNKVGQWNFFWLIVAFISFLVLFFTQTRGDIIGWFGGVLFILIFLLIDKDLFFQHRFKIFLSILILFLLPIFLFVFKDSKLVQAVPTINRFVSEPLSSSTGGTRLIMWQTAIEGWKEKPFFGWGWENYYDLANKYYSPHLLKYGRGEEWTDNAHSVIFNTLGTVGAIGLFFYLAIYGGVFYFLFKKFFNNTLKNKVIILGVGAFFVSHFIRNLFSFEDLSSYLTFFWMLAGVDIYFNNTSTSNSKLNISKLKILNFKFTSFLKKFFLYFIKVFIIIILVIGSIFVLYHFTYLPLKAEYLASKAIKKSMVDFQRAMDWHRQSIKIEKNPYRPDTAFFFGQFILSWMHDNPDFAFSEYRILAKEMYDIGINALISYKSSYPNDVRADYILGRSFKDGYEFWHNPEYLNLAVETYQKGLQINNSRQTLLFDLARIKMMQGKNTEALLIANKIVNDAPEIAEAHLILSLVYNSLEEKNNAYLSAKKAVNLGMVLNQRDLVAIFNLFEEKDDVGALEPQIKKYWEKQNNLNPALRDLYKDYLKKVQIE